MKSSTWFLVVLRAAILTGAALVLPTCSASSDANGGDGQLDAKGFEKKVRLADDAIAGWKTNPKPDAYDPVDVYTPDTLTSRIDGGAPAYTSRGCRLAMYQQMIGPEPWACLVIAMDFVTAAQAQQMVASQQQQYSASVSIPQYDVLVAVAAQGLTGITAFAHFASTYFDLQIDGVSDEAAAAQVAGQFLNALKTKTY